VCVKFWAFEKNSPAFDLIDSIDRASGSEPIDLAIVLGSGWSHIADSGDCLAEYEYSDWSCFPTDIVAGHAGRLRLIRHQDRQILCFAGRFHCYQGLSAFEASLPIRIASALGCPRVLLTCAAGGINPGIEPGDFMWLADHVNLLGDNPLKGLQGDIFVDLSQLYAQERYDTLLARLKKTGVVLHRGVLAAMPGPSYETPAEIRMLAAIGADVVSMSMVHEAIMARYLEMEVVGLALIANPAAGLTSTALDHLDVLAMAESSRTRVRMLVDQLISILEMDSPKEIS
jgi:purine-nucleoside phosphorylase